MRDVDMREHILSATRAIVEEDGDGPRTVTMAQVASAAHVSRATVYLSLIHI